MLSRLLAPTDHCTYRLSKSVVDLVTASYQAELDRGTTIDVILAVSRYGTMFLTYFGDGRPHPTPPTSPPRIWAIRDSIGTYALVTAFTLTLEPLLQC